MTLPARAMASAIAGALRRVYVVGVGMTKFEKPSECTKDYPELVGEAVEEALKDSGLSYKNVQQAYVGYVYGDSTSGQRALYDLGLTSVPIINVNNNCATGSSALYLAQMAVRGGACDAALAVGFDKMDKDSLGGSKFPDRANPVERHVGLLAERYGIQPGAPMTAQLFGAAGKEHMEKYGTTKEHFAKIAWKNHKHSTRNPRAQQQKEYSLQEILDSPPMVEPLTRLQCCPISDGAAAALILSEDAVQNMGLQDRAVELLGMEMATDPATSFDDNSCIKMVGFDMTKLAAERLFARTGLSPKEVQVVELHDCFSTNELLTYEALGLCPVGRGGAFVEAGDNTYGGKYVVNPSGGLISKGHPLGATGLAQCAELCWQLRGQAGDRQVHGARLALQHNLGLGGAAVVGLYRMYSKEKEAKLASKL